MRRAIFQVSLTTVLLDVVVAALLMWVNTCERDGFGMMRLMRFRWWATYGWPVAAVRVDRVDQYLRSPTGDFVVERHVRDVEIRPFGLFVDVALSLVVLFLTAIALERCVVRNAGIWNLKRKYWDDAYWP
jgi:hypothetical protein